MYERPEYLIRFLRGCAQAADEGHLGVSLGELLVNGDLMREAADELERLLPDKDPFKSFSDELQYNLVRAEQHISQAHDMLYRGGPERSIWFKMTVGRAQRILKRLYTRERRRTE